MVLALQARRHTWTLSGLGVFYNRFLSLSKQDAILYKALPPVISPRKESRRKVPPGLLDDARSQPPGCQKFGAWAVICTHGAVLLCLPSTAPEKLTTVQSSLQWPSSIADSGNQPDSAAVGNDG